MNVIKNILLWLTVLFIFSNNTVSLADNADKFSKLTELINQQALNTPDNKKAINNAIKAYVESVDVYSTYVSAEEEKIIQQADTLNYVGVGMDILKANNGTLVCLPFENSPASKKGILTGDILVNVNDKPAYSYPFPVLKALIRGEEGSTVKLGIASQKGYSEYNLTREKIYSPSASYYKHEHFVRIKIIRFDDNTITDLKQALTKVKKDQVVVLDLRNNAGGDLKVLTQSLEFFLPNNTPLFTVIDKNLDSTLYKTKGNTQALDNYIILWQDAYTASAAELFIAAIKQNTQSKIIGQPSFGKWLTQRVIPLKEGGYLIITNGKLLAPDGKNYQDKGLKPDLYTTASSATLFDDYIRRTHELLQKK